MADPRTPATPPPPPRQDTAMSTPTFASPRVTVNDMDGSSGLWRPPLPVSNSEPIHASGYASPIRQHKRTPSTHREVKETLDAHVTFLNDEVDGKTQHRINQYTLHDEIGRGSYGAVHYATDQFGAGYAVKEFSKVRLRKRAQSEVLRQGPGRPLGPFSRRGGVGVARAAEEKDALHLIRQEIAIMKKLNHPNLVQLIEVLDDPEEDSLYMVLEMCKKGVVMKVGLDDQADPYPEEHCRHWFRDLILGIEYLHVQGVIHRDIKPDNLLLSDDDVLKVVDFGVSQMFGKPDDMRTAKSAGSPAFLPPELCGKHGDVEGTPIDIWSMGVSLYCLKYGKIPFNRDGMMAMYEAIKTDEPYIPEDENPDLADLFRRILEKNPEKRITMTELREHPWVTKRGADTLMSTEKNCAEPIEPPNELEVSRAFTRKMNHLLYVMKVLQKFRTLRAKRRARALAASSTSSLDDDSPSQEKAKAEEIEALLEQRRKVRSQDDSEGSKGHAHDVNDHEPLFLGIGTGSRDDFAMDSATPNIVADSPTGVDFNVYDRAYEEAIERRLKSNPERRPTLFLTKFVGDDEKRKRLEDLADDSSLADAASHIGLTSQQEA